MAIAIAQELAKDGGTAEVSVTSSSFTPASGTLIVVTASCYAASGDDTSTITISDSLGLTWTKRRERSQNDDGAGINPPPVVGWTAVGTGAAMTVTTTRSVGSTGFAHVQAVFVLTGADNSNPIDASNEQSTSANASLSVTTVTDGALLLFHSADWGSLTTPAADGNTTLVYAIANGDVQGTFVGRRAVTTAGAYTIGTATPNSGTTVNAIALAIKPGSGTVTGVAVASLGGLTGTASGVRKVTGVAVASLGGLAATVTGKRIVTATGVALLGAIAAVITATRTVNGTATISLGGINGSALVQAAAQVSGGGWDGLLSILHEIRDEHARQRSEKPVACTCGEPLQSGPRGELHCAFDGQVF